MASRPFRFTALRTMSCVIRDCFRLGNRSGNATSGDNPTRRLLSDASDSVKITVVMQECELVILSARSHDEIRQRHASVLGTNGQVRLHLERSVHNRLDDRHTWHPAECRGETGIPDGISGTVEQLEIHDRAGCDASSEQKRFESGTNLRTSFSSGYGTFVGQELSHGLPPSTCHNIVVRQIQGVTLEQNVQQQSTVRDGQNLIQSRINRFG
jgi:hypothetical protein